MVCISFVSPLTYRLHARMLGAPSEGSDVTGEGIARVASDTCQAHPAAFTLELLQALLALVGGDGAATRGDPDAKHRSLGACEILWKRVHAEAPMSCVGWDQFHRVDIAANKKKQTPLAAELFDIVAALDSMFGVGIGRVLHRSVANELGKLFEV